jgi:hypothetical protein
MFVPHLRIGNEAMLALRQESVQGCDPSPTNSRRATGAHQAMNSALSAGCCGAEALSSLADEALGARFRYWRGASGRRYVFSVYDRQTCPAYEHAVLIIWALGQDRARRVIFIGDTGAFPDIVFANAEKGSGAERGIEFHIHLLATSRAERVAVMADLSHFWRS